jgi:hypothetical protein
MARLLSSSRHEEGFAMKKPNPNTNNNVFREAAIKAVASAKDYGGGRSGRPFAVTHFASKGTISRMKATPEEKARAANFNELLRELSPDYDAAYRKLVAENPENFRGLSDLQIDELAGPILKEFGYDIDELAVQRENSALVKAVQSSRLMAYDLDFTRPFEELRQLQKALQFISRAERWSSLSAYCMPMQEPDDSAAIFAPLATWERTVTDADLDRLVAPMRRAHESLMAVSGIESKFQQCRIVHFVPSDWADSSAAPKFRHPVPRVASKESNNPLVIVEGRTVVAALPRDEGNRVTSATVAVETAPMHGGMLFSEKYPVLPDMNAIMAHAEGSRPLPADLS